MHFITIAKIGLLALGIGTIAMTTAIQAQSSVALNSGDCGDAALSNYICGPVNAEELVHLEGTPWVLASQLGAPGLSKGTIYLINADTREWGAYDLDKIERRAEAPFEACPAELAAEGFVGHGMAIGPMEDGGARLYAINHGAHESVEVFSVVAEGADAPQLVWNGCIPSPEGAYLNTLAVLADGGLAASKFFDVSNGNWVSDLAEGKPTGMFYQWQPDGGWSEIAGTGMSGANGVVALEDGQHLIVAEWGGRKLHKIALSGTEPVVSVPLPSLPDNIHMGADGRALVVAQTAEELGAFNACMASTSTICPGGFEVLAVDPDTMAIETIISAAPDAAIFGSGTTALDLGDEIWVGTLRGDKIAVFAR